MPENDKPPAQSPWLGTAQIRILWGSLGLYAVIVFGPSISGLFKRLGSDNSYVRSGAFESFVDEATEAVGHSAGWGAILLVVTVLLCLTIGWHRSRPSKSGP